MVDCVHGCDWAWLVVEGYGCSCASGRGHHCRCDCYYGSGWLWLVEVGCGCFRGCFCGWLRPGLCLVVIDCSVC